MRRIDAAEKPLLVVSLLHLRELGEPIGDLLVPELVVAGNRELATVETYERAHAARPVVPDKLRYMRGGEPLPGYDTLTTEQIATALAGAHDEKAALLRDGYADREKSAPDLPN